MKPGTSRCRLPVCDGPIMATKEFRIQNGNIPNHYLPTDFYMLRIDLTKATLQNYLNNNLYGAVKYSKTRHSGKSARGGFAGMTNKTNN